MQKYILQGKTPIHEPDAVKWSQWFETADRVVARTNIHDATVSTVFIGLDHGYGMEPEPVVFETRVIGGKLDGDGERYSTWKEAEKGHQKYVNQITAHTILI